MISIGASMTEDQARSAVHGFEEVGCDELVMLPAAPEVEQADMLADAVGLSG